MRNYPRVGDMHNKNRNTATIFGRLGAATTTAASALVLACGTALADAEVDKPSDPALTAEANEHLRGTIGRLYTHFPGQDEGARVISTATVVDSESGDVILGAGHAVYNDKGELADLVEFVPGLHEDEQPFGTWQAKKWVVPDAYVESERATDDFAVVVLETDEEGRHIEDVVGGGHQICFDCANPGAEPQHAKVYGYPGEHEGGQVLDMSCQAQVQFQENRRFGYCDNDVDAPGGGASGTALIADVDGESGTGTIIGVYTCKVGDELCGTPLTGPEQEIFDENQGAVGRKS